MENSYAENMREQLGKLGKELEEVLKQAREKKDAVSSEVIEKLTKQIENLRQNAGAQAQAIYHAGQTGVVETEKFVRQNPLLSMGIAFGAGCLLGCLLKR